MKKKTLIWLDDVRDVVTYRDRWSIFFPLSHKDYIDIIWLKNYSSFVEWINENGLPDAICFDHDLGEEKSGYDCATWLINYCLDNNIKDLPEWNVQSANPVGKENIMNLLNNYTNFFMKCGRRVKF
jgi:hypothetical protein